MIRTNTQNLKSVFVNTKRYLIRNPAYYFSSDILNHRVPLRSPYTGKLNDQFIHRYNNPMFSAYLEKRRLKRSQIWPKIHILEQPANSELPHIKYQKMFEVKKLLEDDLIKKIVKQDTSQINSIFIISLFSEDSFKQLIDQYVSKILVCGKAPAQQSQKYMEQLEAKVMSLYRNYYFGQKITPLEREIELNYLAAKQNKFIRFQVMKKNVHLSCSWRQQDQRLLEDYVNWADSDLNLTDNSYRPFYEPLKITSRLSHVEKFHNLMGGDSFLEKLSFNRAIKKSYTYSIQYLHWIKQKIFTRTIQYTKCLQFTHMMKIPPDFTIELLILNIHLWLIVDRLKQFNTKRANNLASLLEKMFQNHVGDLLGSLNIKKLAVTTRNFQQLLENARNSLNMHFNVYETTKKNPYLNIDALVWSIALKQKTERYSDQVYRISEYLVRNWQNIKNFTQQDIVDGICEFDSYLLDPDYRQKIQEINPQILKQTFEEQFKSNKQNKSYYYKTMMAGTKYDLEFKDKLVQQDMKYSFVRELFHKIGAFIRKYMTNIENYDHYSEMDQQKKKATLKDKKSPWKTQTDRVKQTTEQFNTISEIKSSRRRQSSSNIDHQQNKGKDNKEKEKNI